MARTYSPPVNSRKKRREPRLAGPWVAFPHRSPRSAEWCRLSLSPGAGLCCCFARLRCTERARQGHMSAVVSNTSNGKQLPESGATSGARLSIWRAQPVCVGGALSGTITVNQVFSASARKVLTVAPAISLELRIVPAPVGVRGLPPRAHAAQPWLADSRDRPSGRLGSRAALAPEPLLVLRDLPVAASCHGVARRAVGVREPLDCDGRPHSDRGLP